MRNFQELTNEGINLATEYIKLYAQNGISIVAPAFYPSRLLGTISNFSNGGCKVVMAGGGEGQKFFKNIPQYTLKEDTTGLDETKENVERIINAIPQNALSGNVAVLLYSSILEGDRLWEKSLKDKFDINVVASNEQNLTSYFEEKTNLTDILIAAGLQKHIIPNKLITSKKSPSELFDIFKRLKSDDGKIVVQSCGPETNEKGGGYSTLIIDNFKDFFNALNGHKGFAKVATYIDGCNSNVSLCIGNTLQDSSLMGARKGELLPNESRYSSQTLQNLLKRGEEAGLTDENTFFMAQPGTLKVVGEHHLTSSKTNGVGNQLNFPYPQPILDDIFEIAEKLGSLMGKCGKVGLAGVDIIISKDGHTYINEINDRQQGPTESASLNNERNGLPGIQRVAFIQNYGNMSDKRTVNFIQDIKHNAREIYDLSTQIPSQFYIKLVGLDEQATSSINLENGVYTLRKDENGNPSWDLDSHTEENKSTVVDLTQDETQICLSDVSLAQGQEIQKGRQILRINGIANIGSEPFCIEDGVSQLNPDWIPAVESLRQSITHEQVLSDVIGLSSNNLSVIPQQIMENAQ